MSGPLEGDGQVYRFDGFNPLAAVGTVAIAGTPFEIELPARSATLVLTQLDPGLLFADGFEGGSTAAWSAASGAVSRGGGA